MSSNLFIDYSETPPTQWSQLLESMGSSADRPLRARICWGAHEQLRGIRDFSKSSRLRLERFLGLVQAKQLQVEVYVGFPPKPEAFPPWLYEESIKAKVPFGVWSGGDCGYSIAEVPSLNDATVKSAFLDFLKEVSALLSLYRQPNGPVTGVFLDLGILEHERSVNELPEFQIQFERRYESPQILNGRYQTAFRDFKAPVTSKGLRLLSERRPWLAAYDYHWCRREMHREFRTCVSGFEIPGAKDEFRGPKSWQIAIDAVLMEVFANRCFPLVLGDEPNPAFMSSFRLAESLCERAEAAGVGVTWLGLEPTGCAIRCERMFVVCGKYLSRASWDALCRFEATGGEVIFSLAAPQYDEHLQLLPGKVGRLQSSAPQEIWSAILGSAEVIW